MSNISPDTRKFNPSEHLIDLKGKKYLQVAWRIMWLRDVHPDWCIHTASVEINKDIAIFHAVITNENGVEIASAHGSETPRDFGDYIEKAETKAVGRALAYAGFGTQFTADELDEGTRIVDAPIPKSVMYTCAECGEALRPHDDWGVTRIAESTKKKFGKVLCWDCAVKQKNG